MNLITLAINNVCVCIFCFLHSSCSSPQEVTNDFSINNENQLPFKARNLTNGARNLTNNETSMNEYLGQLFRLYGDGKRVNLEGFQKIVKRLDLLQELFSKIGHNYDHHEKHEHHQVQSVVGTSNCESRQMIYDSVKGGLARNNDSNAFLEACSLLLSTIIIGSCTSTEDESLTNSTEPVDARTYYSWIHSMLAIILISASGTLGLLIIPVMQKRFYQPLLQFLVALAVGTLAGDALLHLLPHAMMSYRDDENRDHQEHNRNMLKGMVAMMGLILFFFVERLIMLFAKWRKSRQKEEKLPTNLKVVKPETTTHLTNSSEKQCKHKYSSFPYCYDEIEDSMKDPLSIENCGNQNCADANKMLPNANNKLDCSDMDDTDSVEYAVILQEHERQHHGHSHTHGNMHAPPKSIMSVAWMVIIGDGLRNFTDGMAIGAAFASSTTGGFSTAVAVFFHELPHELGDFAMLLKAGMSIKQALNYNLLSSVLCLFGNIFGLWLGNTEEASSWIFAAAAGMFLYIALVDMIPELNFGHEVEGNYVQCILHLLGLLLGFGIMALIAMYEHDLKSIFHET